MDGDKQSNRSHRAPKSGNKADKKGTSKKLPDRGQNPKVRSLALDKGRGGEADPAFSQAFAPASGRRADKQARRNVEKDQTRLHVPLVDRTFGGTAGQGGKEVEGDVPPVIVAVMGPAGVSRTSPREGGRGAELGWGCRWARRRSCEVS